MDETIQGFDEVLEKQIYVIRNGSVEESNQATNNYIRLIEFKNKTESDKKDDKSKFLDFMAKYGIKLLELGCIVGLAVASFRFEREGTYTSVPGKSVMQSVFRKPVDGLLK